MRAVVRSEGWARGRLRRGGGPHRAPPAPPRPQATGRGVRRGPARGRSGGADESQGVLCLDAQGWRGGKLPRLRAGEAPPREPPPSRRSPPPAHDPIGDPLDPGVSLRPTGASRRPLRRRGGVRPPPDVVPLRPRRPATEDWLPHLLARRGLGGVPRPRGSNTTLAEDGLRREALGVVHGRPHEHARPVADGRGDQWGFPGRGQRQQQHGLRHACHPGSKLHGNGFSCRTRALDW